ncbi:hypothetical protein BJ878DRAFT_528740 [Calycina marina]|uniref:PH domain-containing protein n=1 Tax=Calycina marina TaxID=1763456 RepID=A0A9P8CC89_9HELO|nr:hypothetical protein BJ878DRAFT_528740 [Calycina marina]
MSGRNRVSTFITNFKTRNRAESNSSPTTSTPVTFTPVNSAPTAASFTGLAPAAIQTKGEAFPRFNAIQEDGFAESPVAYGHNDSRDSSGHKGQRQRASSRPMSMVQTYQPPTMYVEKDTLPELQPIFTFLNSHGNKLYQEGYFLKLDDQDTLGRPNADRTWTECFAQLVGTVLSLWDAAELDRAGGEGEVLPKFINLTDSSIKMIESLPTRSDSEPPLQNVLSVSTAGKNRYLFHFNSHHSLIQWTAGIRLAMFEHATLQEAYTGALIAGKGKALNNINQIIERTKIKTEDWARVRFGAGTPWRRCWCVITPPDEKEVQKLKKEVNKKRSAYDRSRPPTLRGDVKFYDTKKTKKTNPIATITEAYTAFAIYPQAKPLIDASTLVKVEGSITIHSNPPSTTEGFVFVMPETHNAVTGFEMMLRWLFPVFDTFALYGRPVRLVAETKDPQSLMFAMPKQRRYGYLEILDVTGLILEDGSATWKESEWRRRMKELTLKRMNAIEDGSKRENRYNSRRSTRNSFGPSRSRLQFDDTASVRSSPSIGWQHGPPVAVQFGAIPRTDSAPPASDSRRPATDTHTHHRSASDTNGVDRYANIRSNYDGAYDEAPIPPIHESAATSSPENQNLTPGNVLNDRVSSEDDSYDRTPVRELQHLTNTATSPEPVAAPPAFSHAAGSLPATKPYHSPDLRRAKSRMSTTTLNQLAGAGGVTGVVAAAAAYHDGPEKLSANESQKLQNLGQFGEESGQHGVLSDANMPANFANRNGHQGPAALIRPRFSFDGSLPARPTSRDNAPSNISGPPMFAPDEGGTSRTYDPPQRSSSPNMRSPGHSSHPSHDSARSLASQPSHLETSATIHRKPLPQQSHSAETSSSSGTLDQLGFDEGAFELVKAPLDRVKTVAGPHEQFARDRSQTQSSVYEDAQSYDGDTGYASTSKPAIEYVEKRGGPRTGVMKTVGTVQDLRYPSSSEASSIPDVDFGPTLNLTSDRTPRNAKPIYEQIYAPATAGPTGFERTPNLPAAVRPESGGHYRSPSRNVLAKEGGHLGNQPSEGRILAWQPGMTSMGSAGTQQSLTAEQFVQQRASVSPQYAHNRQNSSQAARVSTPPLARSRSSDRLAQLGQAHSRNSSTDLLQRPNSRGPNVALGGPAGNGDMPTNLSAREQVHVARVTGQPLIAMAGTRKPIGSGLVGAIENREIEKQQIRQGINSQAVQNAIAQRQSYGQQKQYPEQSQNYRLSQAQQQQYDQYPQTSPAGYNQGYQPHMSPATNVYTQGGGLSAPSSSQCAGSPEQRFQTPPGVPSMPFSPQYFTQQAHQQPPRNQGGQGRGNQNSQRRY